jgi:hypothetical protein
MHPRYRSDTRRLPRVPAIPLVTSLGRVLDIPTTVATKADAIEARSRLVAQGIAGQPTGRFR